MAHVTAPVLESIITKVLLSYLAILFPHPRLLLMTFYFPYCQPLFSWVFLVTCLYLALLFLNLLVAVLLFHRVNHASTIHRLFTVRLLGLSHAQECGFVVPLVGGLWIRALLPSMKGAELLLFLREAAWRRRFIVC